MKYTYVILIFISFLPFLKNEVICQNTNPFAFEVKYTGDFVSCFKGGIEQGTAYLGMCNLIVDFNTETAGLWKGGNLSINGTNTHGKEPSRMMIGDFQGASNIEAGEYTYIQELRYKQSIGIFELTLGIQDLNQEFANSNYGSAFINSSFGVHSIIASNIPAPIFPLTSSGVSMSFCSSKSVCFKTAFFDGHPTEFHRNPYNLNHAYHKDDGYLSISEIQFKNLISQKLPGKYKVGFYYHNKINDLNDSTRLISDYGIYGVLDQTILRKNDGNDQLGAFIQLGICPAKINYNSTYLGMGLNYFGLFHPNDEVGLGLAMANFNDKKIKSETAIELTYSLHMFDNIFIQPDLQYIMNPAGTGMNLKNAFIGIVRFGFEL